LERPSRLTVLVVDDNEDAADTLTLFLQFAGYEVRTAYGGQDGLRAVEADSPDCILLDINMPGTDGLTVARHLRENPATRGIKLIALTGMSGDEYARRIAEAGFDHHLVKGRAGPHDVERLLVMLKEIKDLAAATKEAAEKNAELAGQTKELLQETKADVKEIKEELKEVKEELKEVKEELKETKQSPGGGA
jgi:two-component system, OmpR family, response regulator